MIKPFKEQGQTLIETLVAAFILVMGISAAVGLANYSLKSTSNIRQQTVAMGLAREGIEVIKNMRDTNWLRGNLTRDCYDYSRAPAENYTAYCYKDWLNPVSSAGYNLTTFRPPVGGQPFILTFNPNADLPWSLTATTDRAGGYGLNLKTDDPSRAYYYPSNDPRVGNSGYYRKITVFQDNAVPFDRDSSPRLKVTSQVWWVSPDCPLMLFPRSGSSCMITLSTYLTNWKNF